MKRRYKQSSDAGSRREWSHYPRMQDFRRLLVWQHAHALSLQIQKALRAFPKACPGETKSQLGRAADSIVSNIVEGCGAATRKEFARYLDISVKSASKWAIDFSSPSIPGT